MVNKSKCRQCFDKNRLKKCECSPECQTIIFERNKYGMIQKCALGHYKKQSAHSNWKGGRFINNNGYWMILKPDYYKAYYSGYVLEHVYIYETYYHCCMLPWAVIHHKNEIKTDNRIENLEGMTWWDHCSHHMKGNNHKSIDMSKRSCSLCGGNFTYVNKDKYEGWLYYEDKLICGRCYNTLIARPKRLLKEKEERRKRTCIICNNSSTRFYPTDNKGEWICYQCRNTIKREKLNLPNRKCVNCGTNKTYINKYGQPNWFEHDNGYWCKKCHMKEYRQQHKTYKKEMNDFLFQIELKDRRCDRCGTNETYINKNGTPQWLKFDDKWYCKKCGDNIHYHNKQKKQRAASPR
ncbi:MAG: HNH endonuclease [Candidatus Nitrosocosmicus sp.]|nr:HNH endonuclease [Candidatus Nitrosocosmicus sp.]